MSTSPDYASYLGIHSEAAAIVLVVVYAPLMIWFIHQSIKHPTYVHIVLALFCAIRITSFSMRAAIAGSESAGHDLGLIIGYTVLFNTGFFGLLYSAYTLVLDRKDIVDPRPPANIIFRLLNDRRVVRMFLTAAVILGVAAANLLFSSKPSNVNTGTTLREASVYMFLAVACLLAIQTVLLIRAEQAADVRHNPGPIGVTHGILFLSPIAFLLVMRESFFAATQHHTNRQSEESLWYPLAVLPELLAVMLFAVPGLVPPRAALHQHGEAVATEDKDSPAWASMERDTAYPPGQRASV